MFIKRIRLQGFGRLTGTCNFEQDKCNVLCQDNEFGKTTLMDAVLYALYDFPTTGFKRTELKPKDRYRPWANGNGSGFIVELDLVTGDARELCLRADFSRPQPFELTDTQTWQKLPLDDASFGERFFRMPLQSFTGCFFYRQDDREGTGRDDLIRVIEEAAASNQRQQPSSVRQAISALSEARVHVPEFSTDAIQVETLIKRIDEKIGSARNEMQQLEEEKTRRAVEIIAATEMNRRIVELEYEQARLEHAAVLAELHDIESTLRRHEEVAATRAQREARILELKPYSVFDPEDRCKVQSLFADIRSVTKRMEEADERLAKQLRPASEQAEQELAALPSAAATFTADQLEQMRTWKSQLADRRSQAANERRRADGMEADLRGRGVPLEEVENAIARLDLLTEAEREILLDPTSRRADAEAALSNLERQAAEARAQLAQAKIQRNQLRTFTGATLLIASAFVIAGIVLILANYVFAGSGAIGIGLVGGGLLFVYFTRLQRDLTNSQLEPAAVQEVALTGESQKLKETVDEFRAELEEVCSRQQLDEDSVKKLKAATQWLQAAGPYQSARDAATRLAAEAAGIQQQAAAAVRALVPEIISDADINELEIERASHLVTRCLELTAAVELGGAKLRDAEGELGELQRDHGSKRDALLEKMRPALESVQQYEASSELDALVSAFESGCEQAIRLQTLLAEAQTGPSLGEREIQEALERATALRTHLDELQQSEPQLANTTLDPRPRAAIQDELAATARQREELRVQRTDLFNECDRAVEAWRHEGPRLQEELDRLASLRQQVREFGDAVATAHHELADIADQVFRQWATAINERVNEVLPLINPRYKDIACSNELELSAYSMEVGRRLDGRELQHLSKGARDQLQMALRIAVSEYLSAHVGNLPLVFDEPFAHWDDARFVEGMRFLAELTQRHQVILLSCHHWRYDQLRLTHPDLAARLHFCTLKDETAVAPSAPAGAFL
ncbi:MAG: AAA family ATPase [Candidatus Sumerlaeaceae bacterium]